MKPDEKHFFLMVANECSNHGVSRTENEKRLYKEGKFEWNKCPRWLMNQPEFEMAQKRAWYLLKKWTNEGWYDYGVNLELGWITEEGEMKAKKLREEIGV